MRRSLTAALIFVLALAGCGGSSPDDEVAEGGATTTAPSGGHGEHGDTHDCSPSGTTVGVVAQHSSFDTECLAAPANQQFTLSYDNKDTIGHNLVFLESHTATEVMFRADIFQGPTTKTFTAGPFEPGTYAFHCEVHPQRMMGTFVVK